MITNALCSLDVEAILPYLTNRAEAESLLSVVILGHQLNAALTGLLAATKHQNFLESLHIDILTSSNKFNRAMRPLLAKGVRLGAERKPVQLEYISTLLEELRKSEASVRQYGMQNLALSKELDDHAPKVAADKLHLSQVEIELCEKIEIIIQLATNQDALRKGDIAKKVEALDLEDGGVQKGGLPPRSVASTEESITSKKRQRSFVGGALSDKTSPSPILRLYQSSAESVSPFVRPNNVNQMHHFGEESINDTNLGMNRDLSDQGYETVSKKSKREGKDSSPDENNAMGSQNSSQSVEISTAQL